ncbi:TetR/AcrR family transcriptional regulator [Amylibacter sp. IMCC11727]|uniref:TetR/AcrR family transcriptional regulator n=1 Tax=Amylibacter sp. IMCC11727 TaxID=3039851 RepID=UPI00244E22E3|nr:TetR/AcrR family transcriptional regulator [Amylibacter sp. IMCC11727]WGI21322.1 TetR/AcrR family transcriptional regulator [Amylibacter sp. IMCC11727]
MGEVLKLKRGDLRDALIDYALQAAKDGHIEVMSLRQAARDLGVSSGAVYRHFADKDALLAEIVKLAFFDLRERFITIRPEGAIAKSKAEAIARCRATCRAYIMYAHENNALWHMMFGRVGMMCRDELMQDPELKRYTPFDVGMELGKDLHRVGLLDHEPNIADNRYIWSAIHGAADLAQSGARLDSDHLDQVIEDTVQRNMRMLGVNLNDIENG